MEAVATLRIVAIACALSLAATTTVQALSIAAPAASADAAPYLVDDPEGDARLHTEQWATQTVWPVCAANRTVLDACGAGYAAAPKDVGTPAPPSLDIVGVDVEETPTTLEVSLWLAGLDEAFTEAVKDDGSRGANYRVCLVRVEAGCRDQVMLMVVRGADGPSLQPGFERSDRSCNGWLWCGLDVPARVEAGAPGRIVWSLPRAFLLDAEAGAQLSGVEGRVEVWGSEATSFTLMSWARVSGQDHTVRANHGLNTYLVDSTERADATLALTHVPATIELSDTSPDPAGDQWGRATATTSDVLATTLSDNATHFSVTLTLAEVTPSQEEIFVDWYASVGGTILYAYFWIYQGKPDVWSMTCEDDQPGDCKHTVLLHPTVVAEPGTPGTLTISWLRSEIGDPPRGAWVDLSAADVTTFTLDPPLGDADAWLAAAQGFDWAGYGKPYRLRTDPAPRAVETTARVLTDPSGDAILPTPTVGASREAFDITSVRVEGVSDTATRITLGIAALRSIEVPSPYGGVLYAVGIEAPQGTVMAAYYREADAPNDPPRQAFFCAQDTTVLGAEKHDPLGVIWKEIEGVVALSGSGGSGAAYGATGGGAISLVVPHSCFGLDAPGPFEATRVGAGAYLLWPSAAGRAPTAVDEVEPDGPITMGASTRPAAAPWWAEPFGIPEFWNIFGLAAAALASLVGVVLVRRKRGLLKRYLAEVDETSRLHAADARRRSGALAAIRERAHVDVVRGVLEQGHFSLIAHRIDAHLATARQDAVLEAFGELPHRLLLRLQDLLADGSLDREDVRLFAALLEDSGLTEEAKARVRAKLELWVVDAPPPPRAQS